MILRLFVLTACTRDYVGFFQTGMSTIRVSVRMKIGLKQTRVLGAWATRRQNYMILRLFVLSQYQRVTVR